MVVGEILHSIDGIIFEVTVRFDVLRKNLCEFIQATCIFGIRWPFFMNKKIGSVCYSVLVRVLWEIVVVVVVDVRSTIDVSKIQ